MSKKTQGSLITLNGEEYYKIANYDCMEDFFMTITSSSDIWNFCWAQGGITAGRIDVIMQFSHITQQIKFLMQNLTQEHTLQF
jgi:hypothetical protein